VTSGRLRELGYGPLETTTRPAGAHVFDDEAPAARRPVRQPVQHRARATATEALPQPRAVTAAVFADVVSRTLTARVSESENSYSRLLWADGWRALRQAYEAGWPDDAAPWVFCDGPGVAARTIHGVPTEGGGLSFTFPVGTAGFGELIGKPGLYAVATADVSTRYLSTVRFLNRPG
jgi:hypothetical protein